MVIVIFKKPWQGYAPGERAGFAPADALVLVRTGWAVYAEDVGTPGPVGSGSDQDRALAAAAAQGRPAPDVRPDSPGGQLGQWEVLNHVDAPAGPPAPSPPPGPQADPPPPPPPAAPVPPGEEVADGPRPEDLIGRGRPKKGK